MIRWFYNKNSKCHSWKEVRVCRYGIFFNATLVQNYNLDSYNNAIVGIDEDNNCVVKFLKEQVRHVSNYKITSLNRGIRVGAAVFVRNNLLKDDIPESFVTKVIEKSTNTITFKLYQQEVNIDDITL